ncbi:hypothetical protein LTS09_010466 [Friedmanniomyces endolithicus]|nr:hypothetical protein LTS09_010466 [Friedmanniomyces endolithicus]
MASNCMRIKQEIKDEPEETEYTPMLIPDDGFDDYTPHQSEQHEVTQPSDSKPVLVRDGDHVASFDRGAQHMSQRTYNLPGLGMVSSLPMRPANYSIATATTAVNPDVHVRKLTMSQPYNQVQRMTPGTLLPLDNPSFDTGQVTRVRQPCGSPFPTRCFESQFINSPLAHRLLCDHVVVTMGNQPCGSNCAVSPHAVSMPDGETILCDVDGCRYKPVFMTYTPSPAFEDLPSDFRTGPRSIDPNRRVLDDTGEEAHTVCFVQHRRAPYTHTLMCGHEHNTLVPQACHANCKTRQTADRKPAEKSKFSCAVKVCHDREKAQDKCLRPFNNARVKKAQQLFNASRNKRVPPERLARELGGLRVDGTRKLGYAQAVQEQQSRAGAGAMRRPTEYVDNMELVKGQRLDFDDARPHYSGAGGNGTAANRAMPENAYHQMIENENGGFSEVVANDRHVTGLLVEGQVNRADRAKPREDERAGSEGLFVAETRCVCGSPADDYMVLCSRCDHHFHPSCVGKGAFSIQDYQSHQHHEAMQADADFYNRAGQEFVCKECDDRARMAQAMLGQGTQRSLRASRRRAKKPSEAVLDEEDGVIDHAMFHVAPQPLSAWVLLKCETDVKVIQTLRQRTDCKDSNYSCGSCSRQIQGLYFHCLSPQCKSWNCCDGCVVGGAGHVNGSHRFEALHTGDLESLPTAEATAVQSEVAEEVYKAPSRNATVKRQPQKRKTTATPKSTAAAKKASAAPSFDVEMGGVGVPEAAGASPNLAENGDLRKAGKALRADKMILRMAGVYER